MKIRPSIFRKAAKRLFKSGEGSCHISFSSGCCWALYKEKSRAGEDKLFSEYFQPPYFESTSYWWSPWFKDDPARILALLLTEQIAKDLNRKKN